MALNRAHISAKAWQSLLIQLTPIETQNSAMSPSHSNVTVEQMPTHLIETLM